LSLKVDLVVLNLTLNVTLKQVQGDLHTTSKFSKIYVEDDVNSNIKLGNMTDLVYLILNSLDFDYSEDYIIILELSIIF
jgi:hypothetical protein